MSTSVLNAALLVVPLAHLMGLLMLCRDVRCRRRRHRAGGWTTVVVDHVLCFGTAGVVGVVAGFEAGTVLIVTLAGTSISMVATWKLDDFRTSGVITWVTVVLMTVVTTLWGLTFLLGLALSTPTMVLLWTGAAVVLVTTPSSLTKMFEGWEIVLRRRWHRTSETVRRAAPGTAPMVSIHVPAHAEPPDLVMSTLDTLARLDYPNYEVIVIDNNTTDESLWRPVEAHCARLGPRFRFLHVEGITGAKAGALNWARPYTDPRAELIAIVDADYHADPQWLADTVGYFEDPVVGFVQCPHAYRDYESSTFTTMANAEYVLFYATDMVSLDEHGAGITVGTMSIIRLAALDTAGGWAEWCMTEDSELAIRIHAAGYSSIYVRRPYGRGIIPETFAGYKKQRFRWSYGPGQEFNTHARLFLPGRLGKQSQLNFRQRLHHGNHGLANLLLGIRFVALPLGPATLLSMLVHREHATIGAMAFVAIAVLFSSEICMRWLRYRRIVGASFVEFVGATIAHLALTYTVWIAGVAALIGKSVLWERTDKFRRTSGSNRSVRSARPETVLAALFSVGAVAALTALPFGATSVAITFGFAWQASTFAAAPLVSYLADRDLRKQRAATEAGATAAATATVHSSIRPARATDHVGLPRAA